MFFWRREREREREIRDTWRPQHINLHTTDENQREMTQGDRDKKITKVVFSTKGERKREAQIVHVRQVLNTLRGIAGL